MTGVAPRPLLSIVVGVLNGGKQLEQMIDSFMRQTLPQRELIVLDGGSTDNTVEVLERRSADLAYWRSEPDRGLYDAWNKAIEHCRGDYVGFLGCDDQFADERALERLVQHRDFADRPDLVCSLNAFVDQHGKYMGVIGGPWNWQAMQRSMNLAHACLLHRRDLFERVGPFNTAYRIGADYDFLLRLGPKTRAAFVEHITVRVGADGMSHRLWKTTYREHWHLQRQNPHVGLRVATRNLAGNVARYAYRKLRGRR